MNYYKVQDNLKAQKVIFNCNIQQTQSKRMGNQNSADNNTKQQQLSNDTIMTQLLKEFQLHHNQVQAKSFSHGGRLGVFQRKQQAFVSDDQNTKQLIMLNYQSVCKTMTNNQLQAMRSHINYYLKRRELALDPDTDTVSSIVRLHHFTIKNQATNELIYSQNKQWKLLNNNKPQSQTTRNKLLPSCGFDNLFTRRLQPSIITSKQQIYTFTFLQQFNLDSLEKQIKFRKNTNECFREKEIWSIVYCCSKAANKMVMNGLKEPVLSPGAIFINQKCEIKVGEWEVVNYYFTDVGQRSEKQEGETILVNEQEIINRDTSQSKDILLKYYWPPQGLVQMQNILKLGEIQQQLKPPNPNSHRQLQKQQSLQKHYQSKNSQVFCLGMTLLQLLTLRPYYQKSTYSQKQLTKLVQQAIDIRQNIDQPMSQQIVDLLMQMLQWDPLQRFRYSDIIEYIHQVFESNEMIFGEETSRADIQVREVRSQVDGSQPTDSETYRAPKLDIKRVAQVTINSTNKKASTKISAKRRSHNIDYVQDNQEISKSLYRESMTDKLILIDQDVQVKIDRLEDSGIMRPGKGDDYIPNDEGERDYENQDQDEETRLPIKSVYHGKVTQSGYYTSYITKNLLNPLLQDHQDIPQNLPQPINSQDIQIPDQDLDYQGSQLTEKHQQNLLSQQKRYIESFNINPLNDETFPSQQQFTVYQYVPKNWPSVYKSNQSRYSLKEQQFNTSQNRNDLNLSRDSLASFNLKFLNKSTQDINLRKNISFDPLFNDSSNKFSSPPQNLYVNNLSTIVKETHSPQLEKSMNKQNILAFEANTHNNPSNNDKNSHLFTSQNIMEMIREFTKKQSQQTPDFNAIQLTNQKLQVKNDIAKNTQAAKKLTFEEKPTESSSLFEKKFDKCYGSTLFQSTSDKLFPLNYKQSPKQSQLKQPEPKTISPMVRIQFAKGTYQGSIKNSLRNGYGTFYYKQGGKYSGYWYNNKMDGHGTLYYPDGRVAYEGQWQNDSLHGKGILYNQNPVKIQGRYDFRSFDQCDNDECWISYDGWFENDEKCGFGELLLSNHEKYVGQFRGDMVDGKGKFYKLDGTLFEGYWKENQLQGEDHD